MLALNRLKAEQKGRDDTFLFEIQTEDDILVFWLKRTYFIFEVDPPFERSNTQNS